MRFFHSSLYVVEFRVVGLEGVKKNLPSDLLVSKLDGAWNDVGFRHTAFWLTNGRMEIDGTLWCDAAE
jgi:hypothetical protein